MRLIELDAAGRKTGLDFYDALLAALGAPEWHGRSVDTMIWSDETNAVNPPYVVRIANMALVPAAVREEIGMVRDCLAESRQEFRARMGRDVEVSFELA